MTLRIKVYRFITFDHVSNFFSLGSFLIHNFVTIRLCLRFIRFMESFILGLI